MKVRSPFVRSRIVGLVALVLFASIAGMWAPVAGNMQSAEPGVLRMAGPVDLQTLDPAKAKDLGTLFLVRQVFSGLTRLDEHLDPVPALAESIDISDDGLTYTFTIRRDARFASGRFIDANDVAYSVTRALDPATTDGDPSLLAGPTFLSDIEGATELLAGEADRLSGVNVVDDRTVEIRLTQPRSTFLMRLATGPASVIDPDDPDRGDDWWMRPNASGAFEIESIDLASGMTLVPNSEYFGGPASLQRVEMLLGPNAFQPLNLYQLGAIDIAPVSFFSLDRALDPASDLYPDLIQSDLFAVQYIAFRTDTEPLDDPDIRKALILGFPREMVASASFENRFAPALGMVPNGMLGRETWPVDGWSYDLGAAREALAASSYGAADQVPPITIYANGPPDTVISFKEVIERDLGLTIDVVNVEWTEFISSLPSQVYPAYSIYWGADFPDPESLLLTLFGTGQADNYIGYSNAPFDEALAQAATEQDPERRELLYATANQLLMDDAVVLPLFYDRAYMLVRPWVEGVELTPLGILSLDQISIES